MWCDDVYDMTLKTGGMLSSVFTEINYILKYIQIENIFKIVIIFHSITVFTVFLIEWMQP